MRSPHPPPPPRLRAALLALALALAPTLVPTSLATARAAEPADDAASAAARAAALDLSPYAGKVVYVDFWASWCVPCRASFPWMNALQAELADEGLVIVGVNTGDDPEAAARFLEEVPAEFTLIEDPDGAIARAYGLEGMPMAFVHDRDGRLVASQVGFNERTADRHAEELRAFVRRGE